MGVRLTPGRRSQPSWTRWDRAQTGAAVVLWRPTLPDANDGVGGTSAVSVATGRTCHRPRGRTTLDARRLVVQLLCMKIIASRVLAANPGRVWEDLDREGAIVITKDGVPRSIMVATSDVTLLEDVQEFVFARARRAVRAIRTEAARTGAAAMTRTKIEREVTAARRARRRRARRG